MPACNVFFPFNFMQSLIVCILQSPPRPPYPQSSYNFNFITLTLASASPRAFFCFRACSSREQFRPFSSNNVSCKDVKEYHQPMSCKNSIQAIFNFRLPLAVPAYAGSPLVREPSLLFMLQTNMFVLICFKQEVPLQVHPNLVFALVLFLPRAFEPLNHGSGSLGGGCVTSDISS